MKNRNSSRRPHRRRPSVEKCNVDSIGSIYSAQSPGFERGEQHDNDDDVLHQIDFHRKEKKRTTISQTIRNEASNGVSKQPMKNNNRVTNHLPLHPTVQ